jgi:uncharacterized membrane protein
MLVPGLLAILQIVFVPGNLLLRALGLHRGTVVERLVYSFATSLVVNHWIVCGLVTLGIYPRPVLYAVIAANLGPPTARHPSRSV